MRFITVKLFSSIVLFFCLTANSSIVSAQTNDPTYPGSSSEYDIACSHKLNTVCSGGFTAWFPANDNYVREISYWNCKITVFYQMRRCLSNYDNTEVKLNLCLFDGADPACFFIKNLREDRYEEDPSESNALMGYLSWVIYAELTKEIVKEGIEHWIEVGNTYPIPFCDKTDDEPNSPPTFFLASPGICKGWCVTQNPSNSAIEKKYGIDLSKYPLPEYTAEELATMNDFIQKEVNPKLEADGNKPFLPIINADRARFIIKEYSCDENHCCYQGIKYCVGDVNPDGSYDLQEEFFNWSEWLPECDTKNIEDYCNPNDGEMLYTFSCVRQCEYGDSIIIQDSTHFPTPLTEEGITRINVVPNPVSDATTLTLYSNEDGNLNITLIDIQGNKVWELYNGAIKAGEFTKTFSMKNMNHGIYYLQITFNEQIKMKPILKEF